MRACNEQVRGDLQGRIELRDSTLPTEIEADGYNTAGRFIDFWRTGSEPYSRETVHRVAAEGVVHIELKSEGVQRD